MYSDKKLSVKQNNITLVFVDNKVENYNGFLSGIKSGIESFIIYQQKDGIKQITQILSRYKNVESIHIVSHGAPGTLYLGNNELSLDTLKNYASDLETCFDSASGNITPTLVLYGCNVATGDAGNEFLEKLHQITKADIYASSTPVGNFAKGGNWILDSCYGKADNSLIEVFNSKVLESYSGILGTGTDGQYTFYDSQEGAKGTVAFTDISSTGIDIRKDNNEEQEWQEEVSLPFTFRLYDTDFKLITVSDNGGIIFGNASTIINFNNASLPRDSTPYSIFPFWDDLKGGKVYYENKDNSFIVQWNDVRNGELNNGNGATFQVVLYKDSNNIDFVYKDVDFGNSAFDYGANATIGINKDKSSGIQYSFVNGSNKDKFKSLSGVESIRFFTEPKLVNSTITVSERVEEQEKITLTEDNFKATDVDNNDKPSQIKFIISNPQNSYFELNGQPATEFTQADIRGRKVQFVHNGGENSPSFEVKVTDGFNTTDIKPVSTTSGITFSNINDNPQLTELANSVTYRENALNQAADIIYNTIALSDVDSPEFNGGNFTVVYQGGGKEEDQLAIRNSGSISLEGSNVSFNNTLIGNIDTINNGSKGQSLVVNFTSDSATIEAVKAVIANLTYQNTSHTPNLSRIISVTVNDGGGFGDATVKNSIAATTEIRVIAENDRPVNTLPAAQVVDEDNPLTFTTNNLISISDVDAGDKEVQVTLTATNGKIDLSQDGDRASKTLIEGKGLTFSDKDGTDGTLKFTGTVGNINNALNGMVFTPKLNFNGATSITVDTQDLGNSGEGENLAAENTRIDVTVNAVNDAPVNLVSSNAVNVDEDTDLVFSSANSNAIAISDVDAGEAQVELMEVKLAVNNGLLTLKDTTGVNFTPGSSNQNAAMTVRGKIADINKALEGLIYRGNQDFNGSDTLTITTDDLGNTGKEAPLSDTDIVKITVAPINDSPVNTVPDSQDYDADTDLVFSKENSNSISIRDLDAAEGDDTAKVTLSVNKGILTLKNTTGLSITPINANGTEKITFTGKIADVNQALEGLTYRGNQDYNGEDVLTVETNDLGNRGQGNSLSQTDTIKIGIFDLDSDGINDTTEEKIAREINSQKSADANFKSLSKRASKEGGIVALYGADGGTTKPIVIAINDNDNSALAISKVKTRRFEEIEPNPIAAFDQDDRRKSSLKEVKYALDIINFKTKPNPELTDESLKRETEEGIKQKLVKIEIKLPEDIAVNAILQLKADGTLYDFRRDFNPGKNEIKYDMLTGAVLEDRDLDGKADWAVIYVQDGEWGDKDGLANGEIENSLVAAKLDLGNSRMEVRSNGDGLNFYGNVNYVQFSLNRFSAKDASEIGMARVRFGDDGQITEVNGKLINSLDEAKQAILENGKTLFSSLREKRNPNFGAQTRTFAFEEGEQAVFFVIEGGTKDELLFNGLNSKNVRFSLPNLNSGETIFQASTDESGQTANLSLAGLFDISAKILTSEEVKPQLGLLALDDSHSEINTTGELIDLNSSPAFSNKQVTLKFSLQREAAYNNSAYLFRVDDTKGSIIDPLTGILIDPTAQLSSEQKQRYLELASSERLVQGVQFATSDFTTTEVSATVDGGAYYAPFLVSDGTLSSIESDYSRILTPYIGINSDGDDHIRKLGNGMFGFEDMIKDSDRDFNDMILSITQVEIMA